MTSRRNSFWNVAEVALSSVVLFVLYKLILAELGVSALGVWSLSLAATSFAKVADLGAAGGLGRYVAMSQARGEEGDKALVYVETALITNLCLYLAIGCALYWPAWWLLGEAASGEALQEARRLLPFTIVAFVLQNLTNVVTAALIGFHRSYQKSIAALATISIQALIAIIAIQHIGLRGVAVAQIIQYGLLLVVGWGLVVRASTGGLAMRMPHRIQPGPLRELMSFGIRLQGLNMASFLFDPATKFVFSAIGGVGMLGLYELASRGILQVRQLVIAPTQNLTATFAAEEEKGRSGLKDRYEQAFVKNGAFGIVAMLALIVGAPVISFIWLGQVDLTFVAFSAIIGLGWTANILAVPGYYLGIGVGRLRWNIAGGALTSIGGPLAGAFLGTAFGGLGVATGAMLGVAGGALLTMLGNCAALELRPFGSPPAYGGLKKRRK